MGEHLKTPGDSLSDKTAEDISREAENQTAPFSTESFRKTRPHIAGPDEPESPFPIYLQGAVQVGFGRGGKDLGCPTANLPEDALQPLSSVTSTGIYYGFAQVDQGGKESELVEEDLKVYPMAMSFGRNLFYKNEQLSAEVHIMHNYQADFYGNNMKVVVLGYIRPEFDYTTREALIADIEIDKEVAIRSLARPQYAKYSVDPFFTDVKGKS